MFYQTLKDLGKSVSHHVLCHSNLLLTEVAGEGGPDLAPQKFLLSQKFRHLMRCKIYLEIFLSCLVSEIQMFVYIFG